MSEELSREVDRIAREEGRTEAEMEQAAMRLYTSLPSSARRALIELTDSDGDSAREALASAVEGFTRALLNARWELTSRRIAEVVATRSELTRREMSEEEIAELAVTMVQEARDERTLG